MVRFTRIAVGFLVCLALVACGTSQSATANLGFVSNGQLAPVDPTKFSGQISITGSSTVFPITTKVSEAFFDEGSPAEVSIKQTGTGGGFRVFCSGEDIDIVNASRPINDEEKAACSQKGRAVVGFVVGVDALAIVINKQNTFAQNLSFEQLQRIFTGSATRWVQVDPSFPDEPIAVFSPGADSGTFDYFVEEVLNGEGEALLALPGAIFSEDDVELVLGIEANPYAIGYFGYSYYQAEQDRLTALGVDAGAGAIAPSEATVGNNSYPLARPLFIYTSINILKREPQVAAFVSYYLQHADEMAAEAGYFPTTAAALDQSKQTLIVALQ
jgi:phosphate binding protein